MRRLFNENFLLKVISLAASLVLWAYVSAERFPNTTITRSVRAEAKATGDAPPDLVVSFRSDSVFVNVTGPKSEIEAINDNDVKAEFNLGSARLRTTQLRARAIRMPGNASNVVTTDRPTVAVDVSPRERKTLRITAQLEGDDQADSKYSAPKVSPEMATVSGRREDLQRVAKLAVAVDVTRISSYADLPVRAYDRDGIEVHAVDVIPAAARVELSLATTAATRSLIVNVSYHGQVAFPYQVTEISVEPTQITVAGKPEILVGLSRVDTEEIDLSGLMSDITRDVALRMPPGVTLKAGRPIVRVSVKVRDTTKIGTTTPGG